MECVCFAVRAGSLSMIQVNLHPQSIKNNSEMLQIMYMSRYILWQHRGHGGRRICVFL